MKRSKEFLFWAFFLALCFWAGYLKGFLPLTFKQNLFAKGPVRILNATPFDFPADFVKALEEDFGQKIEIQRIKTWDELQAKMVIKNGPNLILAPAYWSQDLAKENLLLRLNPLQTKIEKRLSPDFISLKGQNLNVLPLYWTVTEFRTHKDSTLGETLDQALTSKNLMSLHLFPDSDLMAVHLRSWEQNPQVGPLKIKDIGSYHFNKLPQEIEKNTIWEMPQILKTKDSRRLEALKSNALVIYGFMIPRNSMNRKISYHLLERLMDQDLEEMALAKLPLGSTLQVPAGPLTITKEQRSSELRDLNLHDLIILEKRWPDLFQNFWQKYNFISPN
jgi:hypothetical protein